MRKEFFFLLVLSFLFVACSLPQNTSVVAIPTPTSPPQDADYRIEIHTDMSTLEVGENVTITGNIVGNFGNPLYSIMLRDQGASRTTLLASVTPRNEITRKADASNVLKLISITIAPNQIIVVLQGHSSGITEVFITINGEIGETDGSGRWWFNYVTKSSEGLAIKVNGR